MSKTWRDVPLSSWLLATRPKTLVAGAVPVALGTAAAFAAAPPGARFWLAPFCLFCSLLIQVGTNLFNDVYDFERGADTGARLGPVRVTQAGLIAPGVVKAAAIACFVLAAASGLVVVANAGWGLLLLGAVCLFCGWLYTGGPFPLAYHGLGEVFVFVFFGLVATAGTAYAIVAPVDAVHAINVVDVVASLGGAAGGSAFNDALADALIAGAGAGGLASCLILVNNLRDIDGDRVAGKRTVCVRFGAGFGHAAYVGGVLIAFVAVGALAARHNSFAPFLGLTGCIMGLRTALAVRTTTGAALNPLLGATARSLALFGLGTSLGLALMEVIR
jgi:1,4-dihydroxy-2-naphthoate octaprenyltransferase